MARTLLLAVGIVLAATVAPADPLAATDTESARSEACGRGERINCVVDGDTFWYAGEKIRVADINTPEVSEPQCPREAALGARASARLQALLNQGAFTLETVDRARAIPRPGPRAPASRRRSRLAA